MCIHHSSEDILIVRVEEDASMVQDEQTFHITPAAQVGGEAGGMLPGQVTQEAETTCKRLQEPEGHLAESRAQRLWRRREHKQNKFS